jgi:hypothetical protein
MLQLPAHPIADHRATDLTPDHEASSRTGKCPIGRLGCAGLGIDVGESNVGESNVGESQVDNKPRASRPPTLPHGRGEVRALAQPGRGRKHGNSRFRATSGRKALTALPTASGEDGATGASAHAQPKAVGLCAPAVVRLERALAHSRAPRKGQVRPWSHRGSKSVRAAGQKELLRYGATADTVKPGSTPARKAWYPCAEGVVPPPGRRFDPVHDTFVTVDTPCGERLEAQGGTLLASHGPDLIEVNQRSSDMMQCSERTQCSEPVLRTQVVDDSVDERPLDNDEYPQ